MAMSTNNFQSKGLKVINTIFQMRPKDQTISRTSSLTPKSVLTFDHFPLELITSKDRSLGLKASIPIKQYTNKFFRQTGFHKDKSPSTVSTKINPQKRFNVLMRKKQMMSKQVPRQQLRLKSEACEDPERTSVITIRGYPSTQLRKRAVTQIESEKTCKAFLQSNQQNNEQPDNKQTSIMQLEQELVMSALLQSNIQSPSYSSFLKNHTENVKGKPKPKPKPKIELGLKEVQIGKISQSRGLELFSKLFIKEKSAMVEKLRDSSGKFKKISLVAKEPPCESENSFQTRKIYPIQKSKKKQQLIKSVEKKRNILRTPMRTIENQRTQFIKQAKESLEDQTELFEIKGWDTSL